MFAVNLNGDDEFDHPDVVLIETVGAAQAPDWHPDEEMVAALEAQFLDLQYLLQDMFKEGGMNQQLAMEAHRVLPEMAEKYPLGYFTKQTTATLYKPALEELHAGVWALIGAASLAIAAIIWKFVRWVVRKWKGEPAGAGAGGSSSSDGRPSDSEIDREIKEATTAAEQKIEQNDAAVEQMRELESVQKEAVSKVEDELRKVRTSTKDEIAKEKGDLTSEDLTSFESASETLVERHAPGRFTHLIDQSRNAWFDIVQDGRWTKLMLSLAPVLSSIEQQLVQRVQTFESIFSVTQTQGDPVRHKTAMDIIASVKEPIKLPGEYQDLHQLSRMLDKPDHLMAFNAGKKKLEPVVAGEKLAALMASSQYKALLEVRVRFIEKLGMLHKQQIKLGEISNRWNAAHPGQGIGMGVPQDISEAMAPAITLLKRELVYMMLVNTAIETFLDEIDRFNLTLANWWSVAWRAFEHYAANTKVPEGAPKIEMPVEVQKAQGILTLLRRAMGKVPASDLGQSLAHLPGHAKNAAASAAHKLSQAAGKAVQAGAAKPAGQVAEPKGASGPAGNRQIPTNQWQNASTKPKKGGSQV